MSQPAVSWVIEHSPYDGALFLVHIIVADTVNSKLELRVSQVWLAKQARMNRRTVRSFLRRAVADGYLEVLGAGGNRQTNYRLVVHGPGPEGNAEVGHPVPNPVEHSVPNPVPNGLSTSWAHVGHPVPTSCAHVEHSVPNASTSFSSTSPSRANAATADAPDAAAGVQLRDEEISQAESPGAERDPLAGRLTVGLDVGYEAALKKVQSWRADGAGDLIIDEAIGYALEHGGRTLTYVEKIVFDWMSQRCPSVANAPATDEDHVRPAEWVSTGEFDQPVSPPPKALRDALAIVAPTALPERPREDPPATAPPPSQGRDPVAGSVYFAVESAGYDDAIAAVGRLRAAGVPDDAIDWAARKALAVGGPDLAYVEAVARARAGTEPAPGAATNGHGPKILELDGDEGVA